MNLGDDNPVVKVFRIRKAPHVHYLNAAEC